MEEVCDERDTEREKERSRTIEIVTPAARARTILCNGSNPEAETGRQGSEPGNFTIYASRIYYPSRLERPAFA